VSFRDFAVLSRRDVSTVLLLWQVPRASTPSSIFFVEQQTGLPAPLGQRAILLRHGFRLRVLLSALARLTTADIPASFPHVVPLLMNVRDTSIVDASCLTGDEEGPRHVSREIAPFMTPLGFVKHGVNVQDARVHASEERCFFLRQLLDCPAPWQSNSSCGVPPIFSMSRLRNGLHADWLAPNEGMRHVQLDPDGGNGYFLWGDPPPLHGRRTCLLFRGSSNSGCSSEPDEPTDPTLCRNHRIRSVAQLRAAGDERFDVALSGFSYAPAYEESAWSDSLVRHFVPDELSLSCVAYLDIDGFGFSERTPRLSLNTGSVVVRASAFTSLFDEWAWHEDAFVPTPFPRMQPDNLSAIMDWMQDDEQAAQAYANRLLALARRLATPSVFAEWAVTTMNAYLRAVTPAVCADAADALANPAGWSMNLSRLEFDSDPSTLTVV